MTYTNRKREKDNVIMEVLQRGNSPLSRAAVVIMLEEGMCTQEVKFDEYIKAKNVAEALETEERDKQIRILSKNLSEAVANELISDFFYIIEIEKDRE